MDYATELDVGWNTGRPDNMAAVAILLSHSQVITVPKQYAQLNWVGLFQAIANSSNLIHDFPGTGLHLPLSETTLPNTTVPDHRNDTAPTQPPYAMPKAPGSGAWDYVWYIPEWSHPNFDGDKFVSYTRPPKHISNADPIWRLRPALRPEDALRQPTDWAKRFGIHPDEVGGRSRLSPTLSKTRDPLQDHANQVNMLKDAARARAIEDTREEARQAGNTLPDDPNYISPTVMARLLTKDGASSGEELAESLRKAILGQDGGLRRNLDEIVDTMKQENRAIFIAHRTYLQNALDDQDWQRFLFQGMTSDELVHGNIFTMSNDVLYDLKGPIHGLLGRDRWLPTDNRGATTGFPRYVYNIDGEREEWNVVSTSPSLPWLAKPTALTNDSVWQALQPALQLATRVLDSRPPGMRAALDMRTRQPQPQHMDGRPRPRPTPAVTTYGPVSDIDRHKMYPQIRMLDDMGFDWDGNVAAVLASVLRLTIGCAYFTPAPAWDPNTNTYDKLGEDLSVTYGWTHCHRAGADSQITITIPAELIWPLMTNAFSQSEKLTTSFAIATTLLHEFMHAISFAHQFLTRDSYWASKPAGPTGTSDLLLQLGKELWDDFNCKGEHVWRGHGAVEMGFDFEQSLWGMIPQTLLAGPDRFSSTFHARQLKSLPLILFGIPWPTAQQPTTPGFSRVGPVKFGMFPVEDYGIPVPLDFMAKFFTQKFWDEDFAKYGHEALKMLPADRVHKALMYPLYLRSDDLEKAFGQAEYWFLLHTGSLLRANRHTILAEYIRQLYWQAVLPHIQARRWALEIVRWENDSITPLKGSLGRLHNVLTTCRDLYETTSRSHNDRYSIYARYVHDTGSKGDTVMNFQQWSEGVNKSFLAHFRDGGLLMVALVEPFGHFRRDIAFLQRMTVDYYNLNPAARLEAADDSTGIASPIKAASLRASEFNKTVGDIVVMLDNICKMNQLVSIRDKWMAWFARYRGCHEEYELLTGMLQRKEQLSPDDIRWKRRLTSVPSSHWKSRLDQLRKVAMKEYSRVDSRIRPFVDECESIVSRYTGSPTAFGPALGLSNVEVEGLTRVLGNVKDLGRPLSTVDPDSAFTWPSTQRQAPAPGDSTYNPTTQPSSSQLPSSSAPDERAGHGDMSTSGPNRTARLLGARGPRRNSKRSTSGSGRSNILGATPGGGIQRDRRNQRGLLGQGEDRAGYKRWIGDGVTFLKVAERAGALEALSSLGVPTTATESASGPSGFGSGGSFPPGTGGDSVFRIRTPPEPQGAGPRMFPHPYASAITLGADVRAAAKEGAEYKETNKLLDLPSTFPLETTELWRDPPRDLNDNYSGNHDIYGLGFDPDDYIT
ncbi:hypothetical protein GGR54DRAFT_644271 [Hypoxylon sp. NC1633]|nr:hypothetical protein GGR54DRAFT_644271 [Hypoxylon sp. NC1633]